MSATPIPDAPAFPADPPFANELAGRRLIYAARDAYRRAPAVRFTAALESRTNDTPNPKRQTGEESVGAELGKQRLAIATEYAGTPSFGRRAVAANGTLLATRFVTDAKKPVREFVRLPLAPEDSLPYALAQVKFDPATKAAQLLLDPRWTIRGRTFRVPNTNDALERETRGQGRDETRIVRRYRFEPKTRTLLRFEEWATTARRGGKRGEEQVAYRREDYRSTVIGAAEIPASRFAQTLPATYTETALPTVNNAPEDDFYPEDADPKAVAALERWQEAYDRLLSYYAEADLSLKVEPKTADAQPLPDRFQGQRMTYSAWLRKPDNARLTMKNPAPLSGRDATDLLAVSDGETASVRSNERGRNRDRSIPIRDEWFGRRLEQAGWRDSGQVFDWILFGPRAVTDDADRVVYRGTQTLNNEPVEIVELTWVASSDRANTRRGRRGRGGSGGASVETTSTMTVYLSRTDGLPRVIERTRGTEIEGLFERDEPPNTLLSVQYRAVRIDAEPPGNAFALPK